MGLNVRNALGRGFDDLTSEAGLNVLSALVVTDAYLQVSGRATE